MKKRIAKKKCYIVVEKSGKPLCVFRNRKSHIHTLKSMEEQWGGWSPIDNPHGKKKVIYAVYQDIQIILMTFNKNRAEEFLYDLKYTLCSYNEDFVTSDGDYKFNIEDIVLYEIPLK